MNAPLPSILLAAGDTEILRDLIARFPSSHYRPMAARAGQQVSEALKKQGVHVAVVHQELADMRGVKLTDWLRKVYGDSIMIVLLTKKLPPKNIKPTGADEAIRYPSAPGVLEDLVLRLYNKRVNQAYMKPFLEELRARAAKLEESDYYVILGVSRSARGDIIRDAYDMLSLRFHPDQHLDLKDTADFETMLTLYKRIGEAYRTLTNRHKKAAYDKGLAKGVLRLEETREKEGPSSLEDLSDNPTVKRFLKLAQTSIAAGNKANALQNLNFALSMESGNEGIKAKIAELS